MGIGTARRFLGLPATRPRPTYGWALGAFVAAYALVEMGVALSVVGPGPFYPAGLALLVLLSAAAFLGSLLQPRKAGQRFYLALSLVPALTVARLAFAGNAVSVLDPLLVYLLLAVTVFAFRQSTEVRSEFRGLTGRQLARSLPLGVALAAAITIFGVVLPLPTAALPVADPWISVLIVAPMALLDEFWFRGLLQGGLAGATTARWGWIATVALFVAYGAPFGAWPTVVFRLGYGVVLGALAMRRENLPVTLTARTAMAVALAALVPGLVGTGLLV